MTTHRIKHSFTAGELSPLMYDRSDFDRFQNGGKKVLNMIPLTQGPVTRRPGFQFIYDLTSLGLDTTNPLVRELPFIFNELQAYSLIFFMHTDGFVRIVFATGSGLVVFPDPAPTECPVGTPIAPAVSPGDIVILKLPAGWDIENFDWAQSADELYIAQSGLAPYIIKRYSHTCWVLALISFTDAPGDWGVGDYPEKVTFHQQRLIYAANISHPNTCWTSKAGSFHDFGVSTPIVDSDAITFTLNSGTQNKIKWLSSAKSLNIGTMGDEWTITGASQYALTPSNVLAQRQTNNGSEPNKPLMVGITTLFIEKHGRSINEFVYDYTVDRYQTSDLSILAPHFTEFYSVKDWTYQQTPNSIIWCIREDGALLGITYQRQHKVIAWHGHNTTGKFKAITCIPGSSREDDIWVVVYREINGAPKYFLEKMYHQFASDDAIDGRFLDSFVVYYGDGTSIITGLDYLEGESVGVLADGTVHPNRTVVSGEITLNAEYSHVVIGLDFISETRPVVADIKTDSGTSMGRMQRVLSLDIDFYRSLGIFIGIHSQEDGEKEEEAPFRVPGDLMDEAVPLYSGIYHWDVPEGYDRKTDYFIRQKQPLPLTIRGITDTIEVME